MAHEPAVARSNCVTYQEKLVSEQTAKEAANQAETY